MSVKNIYNYAAAIDKAALLCYDENGAECPRARAFSAAIIMQRSGNMKTKRNIAAAATAAAMLFSMMTANFAGLRLFEVSAAENKAKDESWYDSGTLYLSGTVANGTLG